jgi:hypothetical protein
MPVKRKLPYKVMVTKILASTKLSDAERTAFTAIEDQLKQGQSLSSHQELWIEARARNV